MHSVSRAKRLVKIALSQKTLPGILERVVIPHVVGLAAVAHDHLKALGVIGIDIKGGGLLTTGLPAQFDMPLQLGN